MPKIKSVVAKKPEKKKLQKLKAKYQDQLNALFVESETAETGNGAIQMQVAELEAALIRQPLPVSSPAETSSELVEALHESEEYWRVLSEVSSEGILIHENGKIINANIVLGRMFGYDDLEEMTGLNVLALVAPESQALVMDYIRAGKEEPYELIGLRHDGTRIIVESTGRTIKSKGKTYRAATIRDITTRKQTAEALRESEERFRSILNNIEDGYYEVDLKGNLTFFNPAYTRLLGRSADELMGMNYHQYVTPEGAKTVSQTFNQVFKTGTPEQTFNWELVRPDGTVRSVEISISLIKTADGNNTGFRGIVRDITPRKQAENSLREQEEDLRVMVEFSPEGVGLVNTQTGLFESVNTAAEKIYGLPRAELTRVGPAHMSPEFQPDGRSSLEKAMERIREALEGKQPVFEWMHRNAQGQNIPCEVRLVGLTGERSHLVRFSVTDITTRKLAEAQTVKRAADLQAVADISTAASVAINVQHMLQQIVDLTTERFALYHAHIYLLDAVQENLVLTAGAGQAGAQMVREGRAIPFAHPHSLVARAARTKAGIISNDVTQEPDFLPNPLLPNTRSELATPIIVGETVLGVFDVQAETLNRFSEEDSAIMTTLARQIGSALQNVRAVEQAEKAAEELNLLTRRLSREGWQDYTTHQLERNEFTYEMPLAHRPNRTGVLPEATLKNISTPLTIQGEVIGELTLAEPLALTEAQEITQAIALRLSAHIDNLRLAKQTQVALAEASKRATEIEAVAEVSTATSTVLERNQLMARAVHLTQRRFQLYHCHVFLFDHVTNNLSVAACGWREGDSTIENHDQRIITLTQEHSIVAQAARERAPVLINNVHSNTARYTNEFLPKTQSEIALPMVVGETLVGIFAVQSDIAGRFGNDDVRTFSTLANALAIAVQNANLYEEQTAAVARLRDIDQLKSSFLANMSHELRTPLNSIIGFTEVLLEGIDGDLTEAMDNDLRVVHKNGQHLLNLINDVLDMAKIEAGRMTLTLEYVNFQEIAEEVLALTRPLAEAKNLEVHSDLNPNDDLIFEADRIRIRQVMINIINNSIKFTESGGVTVRARRGEGVIQISIQDTGIGIPPEHVDKIFQEFTQVDTSTTRKAGGTGLGLPISRHLVELHGGRLWAESTGVAGAGSTFYIELPIIAKRPETEVG